MGQEAADLALSAGFNLLGFVDDGPALAGGNVLGLPVLGDRGWLRGREVAVVVAVGSPSARRRVCEDLTAMGVSDFPVLRHSTAYVGLGCDIGAGSILAAGAVLTADVTLGRFVIVNAGSTISHNSRIADFATMAPGAHLAGNTHAGEGCDIGIGASVIQGLEIGDWSVVGAGAAVIRDVEPNTTVVGCPARVVSNRDPGWHK